ncbi:MAG: hypothetical protein M3Z25_21275, partial [Actinomycetota bacterium]|nr:hypothetical protein [Actinomycetota bacterium]
RGSWPRLLELAYWPVLQMLIWGFTATFVAGRMGTGPGMLAAAALLGGVLVAFHPWTSPPAAKVSARPPRAVVSPSPSLILTTGSVAIGNSYVATAAGFTPGEPVQLSWTGPTNGVMADDVADPSGVRRHGPIIERSPPGEYQIIATGATSGRTATALLQVLPPR